MREKELADSHEPRGFIAPGTFSDASLYARNDGVQLSRKRMLSCSPLRDGTYVLQRGWLEGVEIEGTGPIKNPPGGSILLTMTVAYEQRGFPTGPPDNQTYLYYKTGRYQVQKAVCSILGAGEVKPPDQTQFPPSESLAEGFYGQITHRILNSFDAEGNPAQIIGPGWLQIGPDLFIN